MLQTLSMKKSLSTSTYSSQQQTAHWLQKRYYTKCSKRLPCFSRTLLICFHFFLQAHKKLKQSQAASKSAAYESILSQHASSALEKNKAARESQSSSKRHEITGHNQKKLKKYTWQEPYEKALRERNELRQTVAAMNERLDSMDCKLSMSKCTAVC